MGISNGDQYPQRIARTSTNRLHIVAGQVTRKIDLFPHQQRLTIRHTERFPPQRMEFGSAWRDEEAKTDGERTPATARNCTGGLKLSK